MFLIPHIVILIPRTTRCVKTRSPKPESPTVLNCLRPAFRTIVQDGVAGKQGEIQRATSCCPDRTIVRIPDLIQPEV